ncbi:hypothetical protein CYMTET_18495 [Cymbomonas tetramitiformis]|uniref:Uncharacterized protein n=1 Tax=Cymbomonas tetramitiformis TaxID=36881 RepID=A0AAE0G860_9CHLO|nr:hypothetical protein CYMTET_18495 [Cymbomonas tetramitiformis]
METIEELNERGTAVELYKVKAHTGIVGNEGTDEAAKEACENGEVVPNTDNADTITLQALLDQGIAEERVEQEERTRKGEDSYTNTKRNRMGGEREGTEVAVNPQQEIEDMMRAMEEMIEEETEGEGTLGEGGEEQADEQNQTEEGEGETVHEEMTVDPQQEAAEIMRDLEEEAAEGDRRRRRQEQELERSRIKTAENTNPYRLMAHLQGDEPMRAVSNRFWKTRDARLTRTILIGRYQEVRSRVPYPDGLLNPPSLYGSRNWQEVGGDFVTGLPLTGQGNDAFVAFTCKLSKMVHVVPINFGASSAQPVTGRYFDVVWRQHGAPMKIVCDRDPRFQDAFWKELMRLTGVLVASTTPYNPRSNGQAEHTRYRVIEDMFRSFVGENLEDSDLHVTNVEFAISDSRSGVTGSTSFELCYGASPM